jgi:hypothetical protein
MCSLPCLNCPTGRTANETRANASELFLDGWFFVTSVEVTVPPAWTFNRYWNTTYWSLYWNISKLDVPYPPRGTLADVMELEYSGYNELRDPLTNATYLKPFNLSVPDLDFQPTVWSSAGYGYALNVSYEESDHPLDHPRTLVVPVGTLTDRLLLHGFREVWAVKVHGSPALGEVAIAPRDDAEVFHVNASGSFDYELVEMWSPPEIIARCVNVTGINDTVLYNNCTNYTMEIIDHRWAAGTRRFGPNLTNVSYSFPELREDVSVVVSKDTQSAELLHGATATAEIRSPDYFRRPDETVLHLQSAFERDPEHALLWVGDGPEELRASFYPDRSYSRVELRDLREVIDVMAARVALFQPNASDPAGPPPHWFDLTPDEVLQMPLGDFLALRDEGEVRFAQAYHFNLTASQAEALSREQGNATYVRKYYTETPMEFYLGDNTTQRVLAPKVHLRFAGDEIPGSVARLRLSVASYDQDLLRPGAVRTDVLSFHLPCGIPAIACLAEGLPVEVEAPPGVSCASACGAYRYMSVGHGGCRCGHTYAGMRLASTCTFDPREDAALGVAAVYTAGEMQSRTAETVHPEDPFACYLSTLSSCAAVQCEDACIFAHGTANFSELRVVHHTKDQVNLTENETTNVTDVHVYTVEKCSATCMCTPTPETEVAVRVHCSDGRCESRAGVPTPFDAREGECRDHVDWLRKRRLNASHIDRDFFWYGPGANQGILLDCEGNTTDGQIDKEHVCAMPDADQYCAVSCGFCATKAHVLDAERTEVDARLARKVAYSNISGAFPAWNALNEEYELNVTMDYQKNNGTNMSATLCALQLDEERENSCGEDDILDDMLEGPGHTFADCLQLCNVSHRCILAQVSDLGRCETYRTCNGEQAFRYGIGGGWSFFRKQRRCVESTEWKDLTRRMDAFDIAVEEEGAAKRNTSLMKVLFHATQSVHEGRGAVYNHSIGVARRAEKTNEWAWAEERESPEEPAVVLRPRYRTGPRHVAESARPHIY